MNRPRWIRFFTLLLAILLMLFLSLATASSQAPDLSPARYLTGPSDGQPLAIALAYLRRNHQALGLTERDVADLVVTDQYTSSHNGVTHIYLGQRFGGIEVYNAIINVNVTADGRIINIGNRFVPNLARAVVGVTPGIGAAEAVQSAGRALGLALSEPLTVRSEPGGVAQAVIFSRAGISREEIPVRLMYQPMADGSVRLAWDLSIYELDAQNWWSLRVDAATGAELDRANWVAHDNFGPAEGVAQARIAPLAAGQSAPGEFVADGSSYLVYAEPAESPNHASPSPPGDGRTTVNEPADATASQYGWHDTNGSAGAEYTTTRGNNVNAYTDTDNNNAPDPGGQPDGGSSLDFNFAIDLTQGPSTYQDAAVTNLFYWNNLIHDVLYHYGFDEAAGNFQENNYGNSGAGGDSVNAEAQDGGGTNNANFATPSDGGNPRMQMYVWTLTSPNRDGDLDNGIIAHEYGHGVSNRLTGGPGNVNCLNNTEQMGEGWSDYLSLIFTMKPGDAGTDGRGIGTYALGQSTGGPGIRDYRYSTDMGIDPRTYDEIKTAAVPHGVGSTWTAMLWEMTWALIDDGGYGFDPDLYAGAGGNNLALQLVMDGMALQSCSPGFVDGRDAILLADQNLTGGANQCLIWEAFAKRGLGYSADQGSSGSRSDGIEAFDLPPLCLQTLKITKSASPSPVDAGSTLTYSLLVENDTTGQLTDVAVTDIIPADTTYVTGSAEANCSGSVAGGVVTFDLGTMNAGASATCTFQVTVSSTIGTVSLFADDMESGPGNWTVTHGSGAYDWSLGTANANSPTHAWFADDVSGVTDQYLASDPVLLSGAPVLRFWHHYATEAIYDGGVVEISTNGGASWSDLGYAMTQNGYNATISTGWLNPLAGRQAFSGNSGGYLETVVDLSAYSGSTAQIRFRLGTDTIVSADGWYVDDVEILDEANVSNEACVDAFEGDSACDTVVTKVNAVGGIGPRISVSPASLLATLNPGQTGNETLTIGNTGDANLNWTIDESDDGCATFADVGWVNVSSTAGTTTPSTSDDVTVTFDATGLAAGNQAGSLCVGSDDPTNSMVEVPLTLTVQDPPSISVTPASLLATLNPDQTSNSNLTIGNSGDEDLVWDVSESEDACSGTTDLGWASASPAGGTTGPDSSDIVTVTFDSAGLAAGNYAGSLCVGSNDPANPDIEVPLALTVEDTPTAPVEQFAQSDISGAGTVNGSYLDTHDDDGSAQSITERQSGGRPANRHDFLEHTWTFQVASSGDPHTFFVSAWKTDTGDGDDFTFAYSTDNSEYFDLVTVTALSDGPALSATIPAYVAGTVYIRVTDTDATPTHQNFDTVYVDYLMIETIPGDAPDPIVMHSGGLEGSSGPDARNNRWIATATITVHDAGENPVAGATVSGSWSSGANGSDSCVTDAAGQCSITKGNIKGNEPSVVFTVDDITRLAGDTYDSGSNHTGSTSIEIFGP
jgi:uncharacterized repeat protein (TIGR01451 family)